MATRHRRKQPEDNQYQKQPERANMDIDTVLKDVGEFGRHQKKMFGAFIFLQVFNAFNMLHMVFLGAQPDFTCITARGWSIQGCPKTNTTCASYKYNKDQFTSVVTEWDLVCGQPYKAGMVQSVFMGGVLVGAFLFGMISDNYGRLRAQYIAYAGLLIFGFAGSFAQSYLFYCAMRFLAGIFAGGEILVCFVHMSELVGPSLRAKVSTAGAAAFALGIGVFSATAYLIRDWRALSVATSAPLLVYIGLFYWLFPESPRWLLSQGYVPQAEQVLEYIATQNNGRPREKAIMLKEPVMKAGPRAGLCDLAAHPVLRSRTLILLYVWLCNGAVYYGLTMAAGTLGSNLYISVTLSGLVELPAYLAANFLIESLGRRWTMVGSMVIGGLSCLSIMVIPADMTSLTTGLALLGKISISASFATIYTYSAELYPTVVRNVAMGITSLAARIGSTLSPMVVAMGSTVFPGIHFMVFGILTLSAGIWALKLPETLGLPMPETLEDLDGKQPLLIEMVSLNEEKVRLMEQDIMDKEQESEAL